MATLWLVLLTALLLAAPASAADLYVDAAGGSDSTGDGTPARPFKTLTHALAQGPVEGDHIRLAAGLYDTIGNGEAYPLSIPAGVSIHGAGARLTVLHNDTAPGDLLQATTGTLIGPLWEIEGLRLTGPGSASAAVGIRLTPGKGQGPLIRASHLTGFGVAVSVELTLDWAPDQSLDSRPFLDGNRIDASDTAVRVALTLRNTPGRVRERTEIVNNFITDNRIAIELSASCSGCDAPGIELRPAILNNTLVGNRGDALWLLDDDCTGMAENTPDLTNNIIAFNDGMALRVDPCAVPAAVQTNVFWQNLLGGEGPAPPNLLVDPGLVPGDLHLQPTSPCIDAGTTLPEPLTDYDDEPRPLDGDGDSSAVTDIGADEYNRSSGIDLLRAVFLGLAPLTPAKADVFPFSPSNPLTPVVKTDLATGDADPTPGILTDPRFPLAFYQHTASPTVRLRLVADRPGDTVRVQLD